MEVLTPPLLVASQLPWASPPAHAGRLGISSLDHGPPLYLPVNECHSAFSTFTFFVCELFFIFGKLTVRDLLNMLQIAPGFLLQLPSATDSSISSLMACSLSDWKRHPRLQTCKNHSLVSFSYLLYTYFLSCLVRLPICPHHHHLYHSTSRGPTGARRTPWVHHCETHSHRGFYLF